MIRIRIFIFVIVAKHGYHRGFAFSCKLLNSLNSLHTSRGYLHYKDDLFIYAKVYLKKTVASFLPYISFGEACS